jgi:hypothetical protein
VHVRDGWVGLLVVSNWEVEVAGVALRFIFLRVVLRVGTLVIVVAMSSTFCGVATGKRFEGLQNFVRGVTASVLLDRNIRRTPVYMVKDILRFCLPLPLRALGIFQMTKKLQD